MIGLRGKSGVTQTMILFVRFWDCKIRRWSDYVRARIGVQVVNAARIEPASKRLLVGQALCLPVYPIPMAHATHFLRRGLTPLQPTQFLTNADVKIGRA